ncbi:MAG: N-6 DNA methylase, partial [Bacteroidia bacterium]|nr:N-6 DNA methylase [Bacteroidia bacterium]
MAITDKQLSDIKNIIKEFKNNNSFVDSEDHVQASYTLPILQAIDWKPSNWKINKGQDIKTGKRPDILLKGSGGGSVFVIESKEPKTPKGLNGKYQKWTFAEQLCYYCGSEGVSWGLLTNFIEWRIYNINAYASNESIYKTLTVFKDNEICCTDNELRDFFSLINFVFLYYNKGKLSADVVYYKKEYEIKEEFFQNLKIWRNDLRKFILKKYNSLSAEEIDYYTQKILDRLIFIDVCYDKEIISQDILGAVLFSEKSYYYELKKKFREFEDRYNSELFSFEECDKFDIPDNELEKIIKGINHTDFSNLSVHIIGEVYENYLGELLKASKNASVITEHKEHLKRKAQGIYYTPDFIVNYIIANTVGKLLGKCNTVKDIEKIKVLDIACGSGSFLIRAFDVFYEAYKSKINKGKKELHIFDELEIRKKILLHNLYGVDLDERAVEIAKLNLLLRAVEEIKYIDTNMEERKLLPNLSLNIRHGNSLISGIYEEASEKYTAGAQLDFIFDKNSEYKTNIKRLIELKNEFYLEEDNIKKEKIIFDIRKHEEIINKHLNEGLKKYFSVPEKYKPFNYEVSFCEVMKNGGFDCIIGNPPYVIVKGGRYTGFEESKSVINYYKTEYDTLQQQINIYIAFLEKTNKLSKENGLVGLIIPNTILTNDYCVNIRKYLLKNTCINILNNVGQVFSGAVVEALVIIFSKS